VQPASESPPPRSRGDKRSLILDAAMRVFARLGYHGARVSDIAREAGIAYGLVYHYFRNKEEILGTIFQERWGAFLRAVEEISAAPLPTREKLLRVASLILGAYRVRPEWVKVLVLEIQRSSRFAEPGQIRAVGRLFQTLAAILRSGQEAGELRADLDPVIAGYVFVGGLEIVITALVLDVLRIEEGEGESEYHLRVARTVVDVFMNGVSAGGTE
jgi:TetR/AcrR family transcriptional regulator, fatty acid metabolism regulator protein